MSSDEPARKKLKMEPHIGGDNCRLLEESSPLKVTRVSNQRAVSGSASGDSRESGHHQVAFVGKYQTNQAANHSETYGTVPQGCELGDVWEHKYPKPLGQHTKKLTPIKTGNVHYDIIISDLKLLGYNPIQLIAKGRSGSIILAQDLSKNRFYGEKECIPVAIKLNSGRTSSRQASGASTFTEEMAILKDLAHPSIVTWIENISYQGRIGMVTEFCENGNLDQLLRIKQTRFLAERVSRKYFRQIFDGLEYLHHQGIAHRDICTSNMLITEFNTIKITDFGHAVRYMTGDPLRKDLCGSNGYQAPEIISRVPYNPQLSDCWSLGCLLYIMTIGNFPFGLIRSEMMSKFCKKTPFPDKRVQPLSPELTELINGMLLCVPERRFSLTRIRFSPWMQMNDVDKVQIGNFHLIRQPRKIKEGNEEKALKAAYKI
ncbi:testis-specific serine/threonine-protein kinase 4-like [Ylistrum balloti]|uniref:testis-specific serine/threonine-protein kinase 4-like n=1 Tax=Ylistrum balloti TaxID=509963 RepID=UPI002905F301|nr:testis-specific serine/threonine-protein kinase 4-like [Ylistrum balloti]